MWNCILHLLLKFVCTLILGFFFLFFMLIVRIQKMNMFKVYNLWTSNQIISTTSKSWGLNFKLICHDSCHMCALCFDSWTNDSMLFSTLKNLIFKMQIIEIFSRTFHLCELGRTAHCWTCTYCWTLSNIFLIH